MAMIQGLGASREARAGWERSRVSSEETEALMRWRRTGGGVQRGGGGMETGVLRSLQGQDPWGHLRWTRERRRRVAWRGAASGWSQLVRAASGARRGTPVSRRVA